MNISQQHQKGAPQDTAEMPSSGNSPSQSVGTNRSSSSSSDVERAGQTGAGAQRAQSSVESSTYEQNINEAGDPGRTPGSAEGVEGFQKTGNE